MMLTQHKTRLATLGLTLLLIFASLAVSLAQENIVDGSDYTAKARLGMSSKVSGTERHGLQGGLDCEMCDASIPLIKVSIARWPLEAAPGVPADSLAYACAYVPKISLHMLASVLLI
jgi:hypothetical protein